MRFILLIFGWIHLSIEFNFYIQHIYIQYNNQNALNRWKWFVWMAYIFILNWKLTRYIFFFWLFLCWHCFHASWKKKERGNLWIRHMHWTCRSICVKYTIHNHPYLLVCIQPFEILAKLCNKLKKHFLFVQQFYTVRLERFHSCSSKYRKKYIIYMSWLNKANDHSLFSTRKRIRIPKMCSINRNII